MTADTTRIRRRTKAILRSALQCVSMAGMLTAAMAVRAQVLVQKPARDVLGMRLENLLTLLQEKSNPTARDSAIEHLLREARRYGQPIVEDSTILFFYHGKAGRVSAPGDLNGWRASEDTLTHVAGTNFFYLARQVDPRSRFEYKLAVDSAWILDPINTRQAMGGIRTQFRSVDASVFTAERNPLSRRDPARIRGHALHQQQDAWEDPPRFCVPSARFCAHTESIPGDLCD